MLREKERVHFKMPHTMKFLKHQTNTYEFYRYHGTSKRTYENALLFLYDMLVEGLQGEMV